MSNTFETFSQYRRGKCDKVFTGLLAFIKDRLDAINTPCLLQGMHNKQRYINTDSVTKFLQHFSLLCVNANIFTIVSVTIDLCKRKIARANAP